MTSEPGSSNDLSQPATGGLQIDVVTIFPQFFDTIFDVGVTTRAFRSGVAQFRSIDLRSFATDRHHTVDDRPFGGGEGMVLKPEPVAAALRSLGIADKSVRNTAKETVILLSAQGRPYTQKKARALAGLYRLVLLCGRYEGVDERVNQLYCDEELCIGDYILTGGELAAAVVVDSVVRLLPGVVGNSDSTHYESFGEAEELPNPEARPSATAVAGGLLDYPHYTRPPLFEGMPVPEVLLSGDHRAIQRWRRQEALRKTYKNRPDLLQGAQLSSADRAFLATLNSDCASS